MTKGSRAPFATQSQPRVWKAPAALRFAGPPCWQKRTAPRSSVTSPTSRFSRTFPLTSARLCGRCCANRNFARPVTRSMLRLSSTGISIFADFPLTMNGSSLARRKKSLLLIIQPNSESIAAAATCQRSKASTIARRRMVSSRRINGWAQTLLRRSFTANKIRSIAFNNFSNQKLLPLTSSRSSENQPANDSPHSATVITSFRLSPAKKLRLR